MICRLIYQGTRRRKAGRSGPGADSMSQRAAAPGAIGQSLWSALTPPAPSFPTLAGDCRADVVVVGGGILGLSLALHLAERGVGTALVEARDPGFGASGRNTGFVVPSFVGGIGPDRVAALRGAEAGER